MKKRAKKTKSVVKPGVAKKGAAKPGKPAARAAAAPAAKATPYTPAPIKSDGWPPFRYPLK